MSIVIAVFLAIYAFLATVHIYLQQREFNDLKENCNEILNKWDKSIDGRHNDALQYEAEILSLKSEIVELKEQNVPRETSYNPSYGVPEVVDWINQNYQDGEDVSRV